MDPDAQAQTRAEAQAEARGDGRRASGGKQSVNRKRPALPLTAWDRYRDGQLDPIVRSVPAEVQRGVFRDPERYIQPLVKYLMGQAQDECHKVKLLHDWIADNIRYDTKSYFSGDIKRGTFADVLRTGSSVCDGYAGLFKHMCGIAGLQCEKVSGYGRGYGHRLFKPEEVTKSNHAWNAVKIAGRWHLLDITWDAGNIGDDRQFEKDYGTEFLFLAPQYFIHSHLPTEEHWQLLAKPLSARQFKELPYLRGEFFQYGLQLETKVISVNQAKAETQLKVVVPVGVELTARLTDESGREFDRQVLQLPVEGGVEILARFPREGNWRLRLYARHESESESNRYRWVGDLGYKASRASSARFPQQYTHFSRLGAEIVSPLSSPLPPHGEVEFDLFVPGVEKVALVREGDRKDWVYLERRPGDRYVGAISDVGNRKLDVVVQFSSQDTQWQGILQY